MTFSFKLISFNFIQILLKSLVKTLIKIIQQNNIEKECSENFLIGISKQYFMEGRMHYLKAIRRKMSRARLLLSVIHIMSPVFSDYSHGLFMISLIFHKVIKFLLI